jgi:putative tricarboxylic transport membrane protein
MSDPDGGQPAPVFLMTSPANFVMQDSNPDHSLSSEPRSVSVRWPEVIAALLLMGIAALVITDSLRVGAGWAEDGPRAGYFPFYIGLILMASSAWILVSQLRKWYGTNAEFADREQLGRVVSIFIPMVVFVIGIAVLGIYVASALLIAYFMIRYGRNKPWLIALVSIGVPLLLFAVFERWFLVPLPKGPLEQMLGL